MSFLNKSFAISTTYPKIITNGLVLNLDAGQKNSYNGGTVWKDLSGNRINGTLTNGPTFSSTSGGSIVFDGSDDYVTLGTPSLLNRVQVPLTICAWAKLDSNNFLKTLWGVYNGVGPGLYSIIRVDNGVLQYYASTSDAYYQNRGTFQPSLNTWNFYAVVVSGTIASPTVTIFLNQNSQTFSYSALNSTPASDTNFRIGGSQSTNGSENWQGNVAQVSWYNRALTASEIQQNFNALRGRFGI